jgi:hypothetical protein
MSKIYLNGINIQHIYRNGVECPIYCNGVLLTEDGPTPPPPTVVWTRVPARTGLSENTFLTLTTGFSSLYNALGNDDILIILVRHSKREDLWQQEYLTPLTEEGIEWAEDFGTALINSKVTPTNIQCFCTQDREGHQMKRTAQTAFYIARSMGDNTLTDYTQVDYTTISQYIQGGLFKRDWNGSGYHVMTSYCSYPNDLSQSNCNAFRISYNNRETEAPAAITLDAENALNLQDHLIDKCSKVQNKKIFIVSSHDMYIAPFVTWVSRFNLLPYKYDWNDSSSGSGYWTDYISGAAIIANKTNKTYEVVPVAGHGDGYKTSGWT